MGILFVNPAGKKRAVYAHSRKPVKKAVRRAMKVKLRARRVASKRAAAGKAKSSSTARARLLAVRRALGTKLRGNPAVVSSKKGKPKMRKRKFKFKLRRSPASKRSKSKGKRPRENKRRSSPNAKYIAEAIAGRAQDTRAKNKRARKARATRARNKRAVAGKGWSPKKLARRRRKWKIQRRSQWRRAKRAYASFGGQLAAAKRHDALGYLLKNPGGKRRRRRSRSRKLRSNPSRRRRRMRLRRNPSVASIKSALFAVIPTIGGFMAARVVSKKLAPMIPGLSAAGKFADTAVAIAMLVGADFATNKIAPLSKYKTGIVAGFALNAVEAALRALLPESIKAQIGLSDYVQLNGMYDRGAVGDYVQIDNGGMGEYVVMPDDDGLGYVDLQQDLAGGDVYEDLAGTRMDLAGLRAPIPTHRRIGGVPAMSYQANVPDAQIEDESALYEGMFSGR